MLAMKGGPIPHYYLMCCTICTTLTSPMSRISLMSRISPMSHIIHITLTNPSHARTRRHAWKKMTEWCPCPSRLHSLSFSLNQAEEELVAKALAECNTGNRTSYAPSTLEPEIVDSHFHDMDLCIFIKWTITPPMKWWRRCCKKHWGSASRNWVWNMTKMCAQLFILHVECILHPRSPSNSTGSHSMIMILAFIWMQASSQTQ